MSGEDPVGDVARAGDQQDLAETLTVIVEQRAAIEQVKGMLMLIYGIEADKAFDLLRRLSQQRNVKLRLVAEQLVVQLVEMSEPTAPVPQPSTDAVLDTARQRLVDMAGVSSEDG